MRQSGQHCGRWAFSHAGMLTLCCLAVADLRTQVEIAEHKVKQLQTALEDKEREAVQRVTAAREEEFAKIAKVENEM